MSTLLEKLKTYDFDKLFKKKGYAFFDRGSYNLNIIGIRSNQANKVTNRFDDYFVVIYKDKSNKWNRKIWSGTTEPGLDCVKNPSNPKGVAIVVPGQYRGLWKIALHSGKYEALCQRTTPIKVYRDGNKNATYDLLPAKIDTGVFGINMHRAAKSGKSLYVGKYSAGCQVFADANDFNEMMKLAKLQVASGMGTTFTYTLLNESDLT